MTSIVNGTIETAPIAAVMLARRAEGMDVRYAPARWSTAEELIEETMIVLGQLVMKQVLTAARL